MMKKKYGTVFSFIILFFWVSCDNEPYEGEIIIEDNACALAIEATNEAGENYLMSTNNNSLVLCQIYKDAIQNQIEICGDENGLLQEIIEFLGSCTTILNNPCALAQNATEVAFQEFLNAPTLNYETTCLAYVQAIENEIDICGDDGALQDLINGLGDCQPFVFDVTGNWQLIGMNSNVGRDLNNDGVVTNNYFEEINCYTTESIDFNADATGTFYNRSYAVIEISASNDNFDNIDYTINCLEQNVDIHFTWEQIGLNSIVITLDSDGTVLNFFRNADHIFIARRDDFVATSVSPSVDSVVQDLIYEYTQM